MHLTNVILLDTLATVIDSIHTVTSPGGDSDIRLRNYTG